MDDKNIKTGEQEKIKNAEEVLAAAKALIEKESEGILLTMKSLAEAVNTYDYHARNVLNVIRTDPTISYTYDQKNRSYFKPKIYKKCTPKEKLAILNDEKIRQFDLTSEQEKYLIEKLDEYNNEKCLETMYMLCSIVEKLARKHLDTSWALIDVKEFCNFFCREEILVYNDIEKLVNAEILFQNPSDKTYKLALTDEALDIVKAELENIYAQGLVPESEAKESKELVKLRETYNNMRDKMNQLNTFMLEQKTCLDLIQMREQNLIEQLTKLKLLQQQNYNLQKENQELKAENEKLKKSKRASEKFDKQYKSFLEDQLNKLYSDLVDIVDRKTPSMTNARNSKGIETAVFALKAEISKKLLSDELRDAFLKYGTVDKD